MDAVAEKKTGVHQGRNVKVARTCGNVTPGRPGLQGGSISK